MLSYENEARKKGALKVFGCDEAGRGCLAGPVVAACVHIPRGVEDELVGVDDSKKLSEKKRLEFFEIIFKYTEVSFAVVEADMIDEINIYEASRLAMLQSLQNVSYDYVLTDAMPLPTEKVPVEAIIKGDQKSLSIACASIIAKTIRDVIMYNWDERYPEYHFKNHKGYGTKAHLQALAAYGIIEGLHRKTYKPVANILTEQLNLF